jgi:alanine racemase
MRAWVEVDLDALVRNGRMAAARGGVPLLAMVKADAYGLGAVPVSQALEALNPWGFGVATVEEGGELRDAGVARPIVVFTPILPEDVPAAHAARLIPAIGDPRMIRAWSRATGNAPWHLAIDTGMSRSGVRWDAVGGLGTDLVAASPAGACTHLLASHIADDSIDCQLARFTSAVDALPSRPPLLHAENSLGIQRLNRPSIWGVVRPGIFLYGVRVSPAPVDGPGDVRPGGDQSPMVPEPVVAVRARIVELRTIKAGETVSYGGTYRAEAERRIATVAVGYADGYRRAFSSIGRALLHGHRVSVVGVVTMDMTMFDVTGVACDVGDVVTLIGPDPASGPDAKEDCIDLDTAARAAHLLAYELLTGLRQRLPRVYVGPQEP